MHQGDRDGQGANKAGLGYAGIKSSLAVEFDNTYSEIKNDPVSPRECHLSVIVAKDNHADEMSAIGWNNDPVNFIYPSLENYMTRPKVRVRFQNQRLSLHIGGVRQISIFNPIDLPRLFGTKNVKQYLGITSSTNDIIAN